MKLCRVVGSTVATHKHSTFKNQRVLICRPLDLDFAPKGRTILAVDTVDAGAGDVVLVSQEGRTARDHLGDKFAATRTMILAVVDEVRLLGRAGFPPRRGRRRAA